jgi:uncharacterized protein (DUF1778 family)
MPNNPARTERLDLRLSLAAKQILQSAAVETLPDRQRFCLSAERWQAFQAALDAPPRPLPRLAKLLGEASV